MADDALSQHIQDSPPAMMMLPTKNEEEDEEPSHLPVASSTCNDDKQVTTAAITNHVESPTRNTTSSPPRSGISFPDSSGDRDYTPRLSPARASATIRRIPSQIRLALLSLKRDHASAWEEVEDDLYVLLDGRIQHVHEFQTLYNTLHNHHKFPSQQFAVLLRSAAYLCSRSANDMVAHDEHVSRISHFLAIGRDDVEIKLAFVTTLLACHTTTPDAARQLLQPNVLQATLEFLVAQDKEWEFFLDDDDTAVTLIYEIRAKCLREIAQEQERIRRVSDTGDEAAVLISAGAKLMELGIQRSNRTLEGHIDYAGRRVKDWVEVYEEPLIRDRDAIVAMAFSDTAKRASLHAREGTKAVVTNVFDASISGLHMVGRTLGDKQLTEKLSPEGREILKAAGKVGVATIGAAAIVGEALVETGRGVAAKTADVTADVVGHKYGVAAGNIAKNAAETAENVFRTVSHTALLDGRLFAKSVAKNAGKEQVDQDFEKVKERIQMLEKQAAKMASQTLGIHWQPNLTKALSDSSAKTHETRIVEEMRDGSPSLQVEGTSMATTKSLFESDPLTDLPLRMEVNMLAKAKTKSSSSSTMIVKSTPYGVARRVTKLTARSNVVSRVEIDSMPSFQQQFATCRRDQPTQGRKSERALSAFSMLKLLRRVVYGLLPIYAYLVLTAATIPSFRMLEVDSREAMIGSNHYYQTDRGPLETNMIAQETSLETGAASNEEQYSNEPIPTDEQVLALLTPPGIIGGYRNQFIRFVSLVKYAQTNGVRKLLLPSLLWSTTYRAANDEMRFFPVPMQNLFDVEYWNSFNQSLPLLVDGVFGESDCWEPLNIPAVRADIDRRVEEEKLRPKTKKEKKKPYMVSPMTRVVLEFSGYLTPIANETFDFLAGIRPNKPRKINLLPNVEHCQNPTVIGGGKGAGVLWNQWDRMQKSIGEGSDNERLIATAQQALRPNKKWRSLADQCIIQHLRNDGFGGAHTPPFVALHARVSKGKK